MQSFRNLKVWEKAHALALAVYALTKSFPSDEAFGITAQMRRGATSIPANVAEGCGRGGDREFAHFAGIAMGSACELEYHLMLAHDLGLITPAQFNDLQSQVSEVKRMLTGLVVRLRSPSRT